MRYIAEPVYQKFKILHSIPYNGLIAEILPCWLEQELELYYKDLELS